jgi:hypothetical protein
VAEGARLESVYTFARIEGSNPSLTARIFLILLICLNYKNNSVNKNKTYLDFLNTIHNIKFSICNLYNEF